MAHRQLVFVVIYIFYDSNANVYVLQANNKIIPIENLKSNMIAYTYGLKFLTKTKDKYINQSLIWLRVNRKLITQILIAIQ